MKKRKYWWFVSKYSWQLWTKACHWFKYEE